MVPTGPDPVKPARMADVRDVVPPATLRAVEEGLREAWVVCAQDLRRFLRSARGVVLFAVFAGGALLAGAAFLFISRQVNELFTQAAPTMRPGEREEAIRTAVALVSRFAGLKGDEVDAIVSAQWPLVVLFFFFGARVCLPFLVALVSQDALAAELQDRSARFALLRARRPAWLLGKALAHVFAYAALTLFTGAALLAFAAWRLPDFPMDAGLVALGRVWLALLSMSIAYLGLTLLLSVLFKPGQAGALAVLVIVAFGFAGLLATLAPAQLGWAAWLLPGHYEGYMLSATLERAAAGHGVHLGFGAALLLLAGLALQWRDV
jgi:hypothetical protein